MSAAIAAAAVAAGATAYAANESSKTAKRGSAAARQAGLDNQAWQTAENERQRKANKEDQAWAQELNQKANDKALQQNRVNQTNALGNKSVWTQDPTTGAWSQTSSLNEQQQGMLAGLRDKQGEAIAALNSGSGYDSQAAKDYNLRASQDEQQMRERENTRLAAMGLSTGSGSAWESAQDTLNRNQVDSEAAARQAGLQSFLAQQTNARSNLSSTTGTESAWNQNTGQANYALAQAAQLRAPSDAGMTDAVGAANQQANQIEMDGANAKAATIAGGVNALTGIGSTYMQQQQAKKPTTPAAQSNAQIEAQYFPQG